MIFLDRAEFRPVDRHEIVKEKSVEELSAQLVSLVGENGAEMLISAFRSRRSISGPELSKSSTRLYLRNILIVLCPDAFIITVGLFPTLRK